MLLAIAIFGVAFAAFCIWLTVRIVNRRERWAKWTLATVVGLPVLYVASFGPVCWIFSRVARTDTPAVISLLYAPIIWTWLDGPYPIKNAIGWYANSGSAAHLAPGWLPINEAFWILKLP